MSFSTGIDVAPWLESIGVILLAIGGVFGGRWFSRLPKPYWTLGYFLPLLLLGMIGATRRNSGLEFVPPISWLVAGRTEFALGGVIGTMILATPLSRIPRSRDRAMIGLLMAVFVSLCSVWPFLAPAFNRSYLASLPTTLDLDGVCRQSNDYTCGPAAAVTALRALGLPAEEGQIAIRAHTSTAIGTPPDLLAEALREQYRTNRLTCEYRHFRTVTELKNAGPTLAVIKFAPLVDHYVAVLQVTDHEVVVGDPLSGRANYSYEEFQEKWRFCGIVLKREDR